MLGQIKKLLEIVDATHKAWNSVVWVATVLSPLLAGPSIGIRSPTLARWIAVGAFAGGLFGYLRTVPLHAGTGREKCMRRSVVYFRFAWLPFVFLVALLCLLSPQVTAWSLAGSVHDFFFNYPLLVNLGGWVCALIFLYLLIGSITLTSPKLWTSVLDKPSDSALRELPQSQRRTNSEAEEYGEEAYVQKAFISFVLPRKHRGSCAPSR